MLDKRKDYCTLLSAVSIDISTSLSIDISTSSSIDVSTFSWIDDAEIENYSACYNILKGPTHHNMSISQQS